MTSLTKVAHLLKSGVFINLFGLYALRITSMFIPLITLPLLAARLSREDFGIILYAQYFGSLISVVLDFGFLYSATRLIARSRHDKSDLATSVATIQQSKLLLAISFVIISLISYFFSQAFKDHPSIISLFLVQFALQQLSPLWFFQGIERANEYAITDLFGRIILLVLTSVLVVRENGAVVYAWISMLMAGIVCIATNRKMYISVPYTSVNLTTSFKFIKDSAPLFLMRVGSSFYMAYTPVFLGNSLSSVAVANYGGADRIFRAMASLLTPITDALFPKVNALEEAGDIKSYNRWLKLSLIGLICSAFLLSLLLYYLAPVATSILLKGKFPDAVNVIRILVFALPAIAIGSFSGVQILLSKKKDMWFTAIVLSGGALNIFLLNFLVSKYHATGAAYSTVLIEWFVCILCTLGGLYHMRKKTC